MDTQTLQVFKLRGMDERWIVNPEDALYIEDMFWTSNDSWKTSGGFLQVFVPKTFEATVAEDPPDDPVEGDDPDDPNDPDDPPSDDVDNPSYGEEKDEDKPDESKYSAHKSKVEEVEAEDEPAETVEEDSVDDSKSYTLFSETITESEMGTTAGSDAETALALGKGAVPKYPKITSIHWFAQHNGGRQWLLFEEQNGFLNPDTDEIEPDGTLSLKVFDGSLVKSFGKYPTEDEAKPYKTLIQYARPGGDLSTLEVNKRVDTDLAIPTQSQSFGGRIYLVNGYDEPLVFDGEHCERAGFSDSPPAPTAMSADYETSMTFCFCTGDGTDYGNEFGKGPLKDAATLVPKSLAFYGLNEAIPYFGLGSYSSAEIGAGDYYIPLDDVDPNSRGDQRWKNFYELKLNFYMGPQDQARKVGYQYKVTYVNERGQESELSSASSLVTIMNGTGPRTNSAHGKNSIAVNLPIGPKECVARKVYRTRNCYDASGNLTTRGRQSSFYFLDEISDNMTTIYVDAHPDTALGDLVDKRNFGNFPPRTKFLAVFKNTMFAAGSDFNELHYSAPLFPEVFPKDNVISVGDDDGGPIMGMRATKNALVVFKSRGIYLIKGSPGGGFVAQTLNKDIGCISPNSIVEIPGIGLAFLSEKSVYMLEGALENTGSITGVVNIGAEIPNQLERLNHSAAIRACSAVYLRDKEYWLSVPIDGSKENNICFIYHYEVGSWSVRKKIPANCMVASKDHRGYLFMGSHNSYSKSLAGVLVYTRGSDIKGMLTKGSTIEKVVDEDGSESFTFEETKVPISSVYETVSNDYSSLFQNFRPAHVMAYAIGYGNNGLNVNTRVNRSIDQVRTTTQTGAQQDPNETYPVYGSAKFEEDRWIAYRPTVLRYDVSTTHAGPVRELSISFASANNNKIEIIGYDLEAKVGEQRRIKPLNKALRSSGR